MIRTLTLLLLLLPAAVAAPKAPSIPRFQKVSDALYRGGQPEKDGFEYLKSQGIRTVINLRDESNDEEPVVRSLGMNYVRIPMNVTVGSKIPQADIAKYFEILANPENYPIFIHCRRGADRTGAMVGFYRIAVEGWTGKKAYDEARKIGMRWWYPGLKDQLYTFTPAPNTPRFALAPTAVTP
jgi:tyrosine-protein phosphatase SIW14